MPRGVGSIADKRSKSQPGRYYHLKRLALAFAGLMVFLVVVRLLWGWEAHRRLQAEIDRIVARGEPLFPEDFNPSEEIPDDQNAAILYTKAAKSLNLTAKQLEFVAWGWSQPPPPRWIEMDSRMVGDIAEASAEVRKLVRQARTMPGVDWGLRVKSPALNGRMQRTGDQQRLAWILRMTARHQYRAGDHAAAFETVRDMLALGEALDKMPNLLSYMDAIGLDGLALQTLKDILPGLRIAIGAHRDDDGTMPAEREGLEQLMAILLDGEALKLRKKRAVYLIRMELLDTARVVAAGKLSFLRSYRFTGATTPTTSERILAYPVSPLLEMEALRMMKCLDAYLRICFNTNAPDMDESVNHLLKPSPTQPASMPRSVLRPLTSHLVPGFSRRSATYSYYEPLDERYQAAVALAVRLYEIDHGRRPETLADLVPNYLPEVPIAPLLAGDKRYTYGDLDILLVDSQMDPESVGSKEAGDDEDKVDDGRRQDHERGDGSSDP